MIDINLIRDNPEKVKKACRDKNVAVDVDRVIALDVKKRELMTSMEILKAEQNKISRGGKDNMALISQAKEIKEKIRSSEPELEAIELEFKTLMSQIPNIPFDEVPVGKDDSQNKVLRKVGIRPKFVFFKPKDYMELGEKLEIIDTERAGKMSGSRFGIIKGDLARLEFALIQLVLEISKKEGFTPVIPPVLLKEEMAKGTGYFEGEDRDEAYYLPEDKMFLTGTSEQSLISMHADEVLSESELPLRYLGFSTCFRREAGSYGKDTKGILRVHQFDKLEMVIYSKPEDSKKEHELLLDIEERLMGLLELPYQVLDICTGDLGRPAAKKYDIETWLPSEDRYRETHSSSNCTDFQARNLNIRYKDKSGKLHYVHTLNGTAFAIGRILLMIMENYQQKDGSIKVPWVLRKYCGVKTIKV
jgi:seryl-tRNA synthetase